MHIHHELTNALYLDILVIGGLNQFTSLTELRLDNNIVEKIEGLDMLVNLVRLGEWWKLVSSA